MHHPAPVLLSLVVPVFNEQASIQPFLDRTLPALQAAAALLGPDARSEILFVDDGSTDATMTVLLGWQAQRRDIRIVSLSRNFGKDAALAAGLRNALGRAIILIDIDLQDPPEIIPDMVEKWLAGAMVVNGVRADRDSDTMLKRFTASLFYRIYNQMAERHIPLDVGDFRLLDRKVVDIFNALPERSRFTKGLLPWIGFHPEEVRFSREKRAAGETKWRYWRLWNFALDGLTSSTTAPLRIWAYIGFAVAAFAILYGLFLVGLTLVSGTKAPGYPSLMTAMLLLNGLILMSLGILGEYIGRIAVEVRGRPLFVVRDIIEPAPKPTEQTEQWTAPPMPEWPQTRAATGGLPAAAKSSRPF